MSVDSQYSSHPRPVTHMFCYASRKWKGLHTTTGPISSISYLDCAITRCSNYTGTITCKDCVINIR